MATRLVAALAAAGVRVAPSKPVESGCPPGRPPDDALALTRAAGLPDGAVALTCPWPLRDAVTPALALRNEGRQLTPADLVRAVRSTLHHDGHPPDLVVLETAGGVRSPLLDDCTSLDLALHLDATALLVVPNRLGCISAAVCAANEVRRAGITRLALVVNLNQAVPPDLGHEHNAAFIRRQLPGVPVFEATTNEPVPHELLRWTTACLASAAVTAGEP